MYIFLDKYFSAMSHSLFVRLLFVAICADMVFGSLRAVKYRCWNSAVGIDGGIRKIGMVASVMLLSLMDLILPVNVIGWVAPSVADVLSRGGVAKIGITELFALLFILYELTSVLKNMLLCGIPVPNGIRKRVAGFLENMTDETNVELTEEGQGVTAE